MYKILYIINKNVKKSQKLKVPFNFHVDYFAINKEVINIDIHGLNKIYSQFKKIFKKTSRY